LAEVLARLAGNQSKLALAQTKLAEREADPATATKKSSKLAKPHSSDIVKCGGVSRKSLQEPFCDCPWLSRVTASSCRSPIPGADHTNPTNDRPPIITMVGLDCFSYSFDSFDSWYTMTPWSWLGDQEESIYYE